MKFKQKLTIIIILIPSLTLGLISKSRKINQLKTYVAKKILNTRIGFHYSLFMAKRQQKTDFTFNQIASDKEQHGLKTIKCNKICIQYDHNGNLITIHDGYQTPLMLGSIPTKKEHIDRLKSASQSNFTSNQKVGIFSLNKFWECKTSGLFKLVQNGKDIDHYRYSTIDMQAPSLIDIIRAVHDLKNRDTFGHSVSLIHCKAGRGRSATIAGAYLMEIMHTAGLKTTPDEIENYLCSHRAQVGLNSLQKKALNDFWQALKQAGSFDILYKQHESEILKRNQEMNHR